MSTPTQSEAKTTAAVASNGLAKKYTPAVEWIFARARRLATLRNDEFMRMDDLLLASKEFVDVKTKAEIAAAIASTGDPEELKRVERAIVFGTRR